MLNENTETLQQKQAWTLDQKIFHFFEVVDQYYHRYNGEVYLSFSGGKDSTVLKYLLDKWLGMNGYPKLYMFLMILQTSTKRYFLLSNLLAGK